MIHRELLCIIRVMKQAVLTPKCHEFVDVKCPYCGRVYFYVKDSLYRPHTCTDYQCVRKDLHPNIKTR